MKKCAMRLTITVNVPSTISPRIRLNTQDKDPMPAIFEAADVFHMTDSPCENTTECACKCSHTEKDCDSEGKFVSFVEICEVEGDAREISCFHHAKENTCNQQSCKVLDKSHQG